MYFQGLKINKAKKITLNNKKKLLVGEPVPYFIYRRSPQKNEQQEITTLQQISTYILHVHTFIVAIVLRS